MSSFDKTVKLACKPKAAPPKAKYLDPIIAATYSEDGAVHDVCRALSPRFREPNAIVVFKALIVLHTMIRNGATDNVLGYLSNEDVLKLRNVSAGQWEGYDTPKNLQNYAVYLDSRIRTYRDLKHDPVRVQSDSNRDIRVENSVEESRANSSTGLSGPQRRQTIMGRKLRSMSVEKGLLRETKAVQRTTNAVLECRFYLDNLEDELNVTALRMLVKDLIILFQALNEGVINVLEHYFEMSKVDAETALAIYRNFCKQTERVVEYLGVARKLQNLLNVPIPNLKYAPVSLVAALEEYLRDPNFEQNRIEYRTNKALADKNTKEGSKKPSARKADIDKAGSSSTPPPPNSGASSSATEPKAASSSKEPNQALVDFFSSIEEEQTNMFNPAANNQLQQQAVHNPFVQRQSMMMTGAFPQQPFGQPQMSQQTGFVQPQHTAFPGPFQQPNVFAQPSHPAFSSFLQPQPTGFLQPQATGSNPFRQSMLMPQMTAMPGFGLNGAPGSNPGPFQAPGPSFSVPPPSDQIHSAQGNAFASLPFTNGVASPPNGSQGGIPQDVPQRPASTPITSNTKSFGQAMQPVVSHQTGSRNPFGVPQEPAPPVPKAPTLQEIATGAFGGGMFGQQRAQSPVQQQAQTNNAPLSATAPFSTFGSFSQNPSTSSTDGSQMSSIASSFTFNNDWALNSNKVPLAPTGTPSVASQTTSTSAFSSQPTGTTNATSLPSTPLSPLQPQTTGFTGIKAFKPTSSFGASLLESLPPIPQSGPSSPPANGLPSTQPTGSGLGSPIGFGSVSNTANTPSFGGLGASSTSNTANAPSFGGASAANGQNTGMPGFGALNAQATGLPAFGGGSGPAFGSNLGTGLRPQMTGGGMANPFRASMFSPATSGPGAPSLPSSQFGAPPSSFGANVFQNTSGNGPKQLNGQQNGVASLI